MMADVDLLSPLGVGMLLFLAGAGMHLLIGILTPFFAFRRISPQSILFVSVRSDTELFGATPETHLSESPMLVTLRRILITAIAGLLVGFGVVEVALIWFGIGGGHRWAVIALAVSGAAMLPYWRLVFRPYRAARIRLTVADLPPFIWVPTATFVPATALTWLGLG
jgi:hypothetical protein